MMDWRIGLAACLLGLAAASGAVLPAAAAEVRAELRQVTATGTGDPVGVVIITDTPAGAAVKTALKGLPPGPHGFHIHENGSCQPATVNGQPVAAGAAGGHFDPQKTGKHEGPQGAGHLGDLPLLEAAADGSASRSFIAPHIHEVAALRGKAIVVHAGGDNYSDQPAPLGGGGARIACGILQ